MNTSLFFQNVRVFDGTQVVSDTNVFVEHGKISAVGPALHAPAEAQIIEGAGRTLLPGLIDAHTHTFEQMLVEALMFGVTTELDMFTDYHMVAEIKRAQDTDGNPTMADLFSSGTLATVPHGHGTEYGLTIPTLTSPEEAQAFVDARISEGSDYIKIVYDNAHAYGMDIPTLDKATMAALVEAAHKRGKLTLVHIARLQDARDAIEVGADGLAHLFIDQSPDPEFGAFVAAHHAFVVPTLTVLESVCGTASGASLIDDAHLAPYLTKYNVTSLRQSFSHLGKSTRVYSAAEEAIRQLKAAGVPILAGTDAPNPGTSHGASLHRELELLVQAGLTPLEALASATSVTADTFGLRDRGRIAEGLRADLVLIEGDPTRDITATRAIVGVWKLGIETKRTAYRVQIEQQRKEDAERQAPAGSESGLISDFRDLTLKTQFGAGWDISTDSFRGGKSTAQYEVVEEGANESKGSLLIQGEIASELPYAWAGAVFYPGTPQWTPANLAEKKGISFWTKGDGRTYLVMIFAAGLMTPAQVSFIADEHWQQYTFTFSEFGDINTREIMSLLFVANPTPGAFAFQIDDVRLTK